MKLKALEEKRSEILAQIEEENKSETRSIDKVDELLAKLDEVNKEIKVEERLLEVMDKNKTVEKKQEMRDFNAEIRAAIESEKELDITNFEVEERAMGTPNSVGQGGTSIGNIAKTTFANAVLKKATETSDLYAYVRKENFGAALHQIPVQKTKITEFANVKELADYTEKNIDFEPIQLAAHKYGNISIISEECLADTGYNIMSELLEQYGEGAGLTLDKLMVVGDTNVQGLNSFNNAGTMQNGAIKVEVAKADADSVGLDELMKTYNSLPQKYRKNATWVIGTELAGILTETVDGVGRPLLSTDFSQVPFGGKATPMLLGRPVVISDHVNGLTASKNQPHKPLAFFGQLDKALILGLRQSFAIKSSTEYKFASDGVAVKGTMRFDIKRALGEALAVLTTGA